MSHYLFTKNYVDASHAVAGWREPVYIRQALRRTRGFGVSVRGEWHGADYVYDFEGRDGFSAQLQIVYRVPRIWLPQSVHVDITAHPSERRQEKNLEVLLEKLRGFGLIDARDRR